MDLVRNLVYDFVEFVPTLSQMMQQVGRRHHHTAVVLFLCLQPMSNHEVESTRDSVSGNAVVGLVRLRPPSSPRHGDRQRQRCVRHRSPNYPLKQRWGASTALAVQSSKAWTVCSGHVQPRVRVERVECKRVGKSRCVYCLVRGALVDLRLHCTWWPTTR